MLIVSFSPTHFMFVPMGALKHITQLDNYKV